MSASHMSWKAFVRYVAKIAVPISLQSLMSTTASMVDTIMIAPLGEITVGAIGLCAQYASLLNSAFYGFIGGGMLFFSQFWGAREEDELERFYGLTLCCMLAVSLLFGSAAVLVPEKLMNIYTNKPVIQQIGTKYLRIAGCGFPLLALGSCMSTLLRCTEKVKIPFWASVGSVLTNIFLNYVLIFGRLGFPALGVEGAALATTCSHLVYVLVMASAALIQKHPYLFRFRQHFRWNLQAISLYLKRCFPVMCNGLSMGIAGMLLNMVLGRQSEQAIAAIAVFRTLEGLIIAFFSGFSSATGILSGNYVGAGELKSAYDSAKRLLVLCIITMFSACVLLLCIHRPLLTAMSLQGESLQLCFQMLLVYCIAAVVRMCNWDLNDTFRAAGDATTGMVLEASFMYLMVLPCVFLTGIFLKAPFLLVFSCCYIDEPIRLVLMLRQLFSGKWIRPVTPEGQAALPAFRKMLQERKKKPC